MNFYSPIPKIEDSNISSSSGPEEAKVDNGAKKIQKVETEIPLKTLNPRKETKKAEQKVPSNVKPPLDPNVVSEGKPKDSLVQESKSKKDKKIVHKELPPLVQKTEGNSPVKKKDQPVPKNKQIDKDLKQDFFEISREGKLEFDETYQTSHLSQVNNEVIPNEQIYTQNLKQKQKTRMREPPLQYNKSWLVDVGNVRKIFFNVLNDSNLS